MEACLSQQALHFVIIFQSAYAAASSDLQYQPGRALRRKIRFKQESRKITIATWSTGMTRIRLKAAAIFMASMMREGKQD
jgi:hypothetical protein